MTRFYFDGRYATSQADAVYPQFFEALEFAFMPGVQRRNYVHSTDVYRPSGVSDTRIKDGVETGYFNGAEGSHVALTNFVKELNVLTLACWVNVTAWPGTFPQLSAMFSNSDPATYGGIIFRFGDATDANKDKVYVGFMTKDGVESSVAGSTAIAVNRWYHVAASMINGASIRVFVNGKLETSTSSPTARSMTPVTNWRLYDETPSSYVRNLNGCMEDAMLWSRALSDGEIIKLYRLGIHGWAAKKKRSVMVGQAVAPPAVSNAGFWNVLVSQGM